MLPGMIACLIALAVCSCGTAKENDALTAQADRVSTILEHDVELNPNFLASAYAEFADKEFTIYIVFEDERVKLSDYTDAFIEYFVAEELKNNAGDDLAEIVNSLAKIDGKMVLQLSDSYGTTRSFDFSVQQIKYLARTPRTKLNFNEVKAQALQLMADSWVDVRKAHNADDVTFEVITGFATYTVLFNDDKPYQNLTSANLKDRVLKAIEPEYDRFGTFKPIVIEMFRSFGIDGYRYIYTNKVNDKSIKTVVSWRELE
jgi:plasmid maintenance system antidote protein VapI